MKLKRVLKITLLIIILVEEIRSARNLKCLVQMTLDTKILEEKINKIKRSVNFHHYL